jgi:hypothetical protein
MDLKDALGKVHLMIYDSWEQILLRGATVDSSSIVSLILHSLVLL